MNFHGVGTEIVETARIARMVDKHGEPFLRRVFTEREIQFCQAHPLRTELLAARWAGKVALLRSLGLERPSHPGLWADFEIVAGDAGRPQAMAGGAAKELLVRLRIADIALTLAHCRSYATATAIAFVEDAAPHP